MRSIHRSVVLAAALLLAPASLAEDPSPRGLPVENLNTDAEYATLQAAIDDASPGDFLRVDNTGLIETNITIDKAITIIGQGEGQSYIDAGSTGRCMSIVNASPVRIIGIGFRNGLVSGADGGGVLIDNSSVTFEGCTFLGCGVNGGGLGGALFAFGGSSVDIDRSLILQNFANLAAAIWAPGASSVRMTNTQLSDNNAASDGDGELMIFQNGSSLAMAHCTAARNGTNSPSNSLIAAGVTEPVEVVGSILWGNNTLATFATGNLTAFANIYPGAVAPDNLDTDPGFRDFDNFDFRLAPGSPAIDAGFANPLADFDPISQLATNIRASDASKRTRFYDDPRSPDTGAGFFGPQGLNTGVPFLPVPDIGAHEFRGGQCAADLALPFGTLNFSDVLQYLTDFAAGCF